MIREGEVVSGGFGVRDAGAGAMAAPETMFHLASVSKPIVATAIVSLATARNAGEPVLDLQFELDDEGFVQAVRGALELHRTRMVWPLPEAWTALRPDTSAAWTMTGCGPKVDGNLDLAGQGDPSGVRSTSTPRTTTPP